jgi:putative ABC transport system permease protein
MVVLFSGLAGSVEPMMSGIITDSSLGHLQIHQKGYVASIDTLPLDMNMKPQAYQKLDTLLQDRKDVEAYSPRLKFGAMLSNYAESTNVRITAVDPQKEIAACPALNTRLTVQPKDGAPFLKRGEVLVPQKVASAMGITTGTSIVLIATNKDSSVNGMEFVVAGLIEDIMGPSGKDTYIHIDDARSLLRTKGAEVTEIAIRVPPGIAIESVAKSLNKEMAGYTNEKGTPVFEVHSWRKLSPFANIAGMIDLMIITVKIIMIAIVLISVLNVMLMSVFERIREIGTIAAMGTQPSKILALFVAEGFCLGLLGTISGLLLGVAGLLIVKKIEISFTFGKMQGLILRPEIHLSEILVIAAIVLFASTLAALQPAWKASRMEPIDALGHV